MAATSLSKVFPQANAVSNPDCSRESKITASARLSSSEDWRRENLAFEINRLRKIIRTPEIEPTERVIAELQLWDYLAQTEVQS